MVGSRVNSLDILELIGTFSYPYKYYDVLSAELVEDEEIIDLYRCKCFLCEKEYVFSNKELEIRQASYYNYRVSHDYFYCNAKCECHPHSSLQWKVNKALLELDLNYSVEYKFKNLLWVSHQTLLSFDFAILDEEEPNILIECQGEQHYRPVDEFGGEPAYRKQVLNDDLKREFCSQNNKTLIEIPYNKKYDDIIKQIREVVLMSNEVMKNKARERVESNKNNYAKEIMFSKEGAKIYRDVVESMINEGNTPILKLIRTDVVSAIEQFRESKKIAVLNFASYKHPGGGFMNGMMAQEEAICHSSTLYNVISQFANYYTINNSRLNLGLYTNAAIYTKDIVFFTEKGDVKCDVITCAAPNKSVGIRYNKFSDEMNYEALEDRIRFIRDITTNYDIDTLILGAYGCGVFRQDAFEVATLMKKYFSKSNVRLVVFAIPDKRNYEPFEQVINCKEEGQL